MALMVLELHCILMSVTPLLVLFEGCVGTHAMSGAWGLLVPGLFIRKDNLLDALFLHNARSGAFYVSNTLLLNIHFYVFICI